MNIKTLIILLSIGLFTISTLVAQDKKPSEVTKLQDSIKRKHNVMKMDHSKMNMKHDSMKMDHSKMSMKHDSMKMDHSMMKHLENDKIFVCPMHPEAENEKPGQCPKCGMKLEEKIKDKELGKNKIKNTTNKKHNH